MFLQRLIAGDRFSIPYQKNSVRVPGLPDIPFHDNIGIALIQLDHIANASRLLTGNESLPLPPKGSSTMLFVSELFIIG